MPFATIINKDGTDKTVILNVRTFLLQPFEATDWVDLRIGLLLSLTKAAADDDPTGLAEEFAGGTDVADRSWIGIKTRDSSFPRTPGTVFIGYSTADRGVHDGLGHSKLVSSDSGIGTTNAYFWRPKNTSEDLYGLFMTLDGAGAPIMTTDGTQHHFAQDPSNSGGYATLLMIRLQRPDTGPNAKRLTVSVKTSTGHSGDVLFTDTPTKDLLQNNMEAFPGTVQQIGPVVLSSVPDAFFLYWPFHDSRLRIHCMGIEKIR